MPKVYWIEDELDRLTLTFEMIEEVAGKGEIEVLRDASAARRAIDRIRADQALVVLDLYIPTGDPKVPPNEQRGPIVGLRLLGEIQEKLGNRWPIFLVSGNISFDIREQLTTKHAIPQERIFTKPLNAKNERLVKSVGEAVLALAPGGTMPPA